MRSTGWSRWHHQARRSIGLLVGIAILGVSWGVPAQAQETQPPQVSFWLTVLHNNDGESQLIDAGSGQEDFGGAARFATVVKQLRREALLRRPLLQNGFLLVSSGDNFLAGPEFNASLEHGVPFFDTMAMNLIRYDAIAIGNHEFDFGPDVLADFIRGFELPPPFFFRFPPPFLSANLDFTPEPNLQALVERRRIAASAVVTRRGQRIGIVGATTPNLRFISSPRNVGINPDVLGAIQAEVDRLTASGINKIILISHLQSIQEDLALATELRGVDIMVAGGGDELLANVDDLLIPGDEGEVFGPYPLVATDADGNDVPVVTTSGQYRYVGRLVVGFDESGRVVALDQESSGPVRVSGVGPDAVTPDFPVDFFAVDPVEQAVADLAANIIGTSTVELDGRRSQVRTVETNEGNLVADALHWQAERLAASFGVPVPDVALQNGGGIRNDSILPAGNISELDTFDILPFPNFVTVLPDIPADQFKEILENAVSRVESVSGRFAQVAGFTMVWDAEGTPQELDEEGNVVTPGTRVQEVTLADGITAIVLDGDVVPGAPPVTIATIDFLARGGDQYPFREAPFTALGVTYQQALRNYIESPEGLMGMITAAQYPVGGEGRITRLN